MKRSTLSSLCAVAAAGILLIPLPAGAETDAEVDAHRAALDLAGAFTNDGFKLRDGDFTGTLKPGESALVQVNLYAGNQYWFAVSTSDGTATLALNVYDEAGKLVKTDVFTSQAQTSGTTAAKAAPPATTDPDATATNRAAAGFAPDTSGPYYVKIANHASAPATYCLIYSYK